MSGRRSRQPGILHTLASEVAPYPGRLRGSLRDTLGVVFAVVLAMTLHVPGIALALALLYMQRERSCLTIGNGFQILSGVAIAAIATLFWVQITDGTEVARFFGVMFCIFIAAFCMAVTTYPMVSTMFGFYGFLNLAQWDAHRGTNAIVTDILYNLAAVAIVTLSAIGLEYLFGTRNPSEDLARAMEERLSLLSRFFHAMARPQPEVSTLELDAIHTSLVGYAHARAQRMNELYRRICDHCPDLSGVPVGKFYRIDLLASILEKSALIGFRREGCVGCLDHYAAVAALCDSLQRAVPGPVPLLLPNAPSLLREIYTELRQYAATRPLPMDAPAAHWQPAQPAASSFSVFLPGAFQNADAATHALKLTFAAILCYTIYNAIAWPGISICVLTVLLDGLSTNGAAKQKSLYRLVGAAIGGFLGIATVSLLFPNTDSITALVLAVAPVALFAGWMLRCPHMSAIGVQIGFAYFLTVLPDFRAATHLVPARDRVMGVALGILVMWFVFDLLWPRRISTVLQRILGNMLDAETKLRGIHQLSDPAEAARALSRLRVAVTTDLENVHRLESAVYFDFGQGYERELVLGRRLIRKIQASAAEFYAEVLRLRSEGSFQARRA
jgi:multidrug resistance protein MdtO